MKRLLGGSLFCVIQLHAGIVVDFTNDDPNPPLVPEFNSALNTGEITLDFSIDSLGSVTLDASSTKSLAASYIDAFDGVVGTVNDNRLFGKAFAMTIALNGGQDIRVNKDLSGLSIRGLNQHRIDGGTEQLLVTTDAVGMQVELKSIGYSNATMSTGTSLDLDASSYELFSNQGLVDVSSQEVLDAFTISSASDDEEQGFTLSSLGFDLIATDTIFSENKVLNSSFEDGGIAPNPWTLNNGSVVGSGEAAQGVGSASLKISNASSNARQTFAVTPNTNYDVSVWVDSTGMTTGSAIIDLSDKPSTTEEVQFVINTSVPGWFRYTGTFNSGSETSITMRLFTNAGMEGVVYFDNVVVEESPPPPLEVATIINTDFSQNNQGISYTIDSDTERSRLWNETTPMYNGIGTNGTIIHGGLKITADSGAQGFVGVNSSFGRLFARHGNPATNPSTNIFYLWDSSQFLETGKTVFDNRPECHLTVVARSTTGESGGLRFVIRDGSTYYISNQTAVDSGQNNTTVVHQGDLAGLQWASFDPNNFADFDDDDPNLGFGSVTFQTQSFENVTGVGMIGNVNSTTNCEIVIEDFQATLTNGGVGGLVQVNGAFTENMVLQRDENVAIYGTAVADDSITVKFGDQTKTALADINGNWIAYLDPMPASFVPRTLEVSNTVNTITLGNILVGDVWLASGQSNMGRSFSAYNQLTTVGKDDPNIRLLLGAILPIDTPQEEFQIDSSHGTWVECSAAYLTTFSPAAYFFADKLQSDLGIPIGIIESARGSTIAESWTPTSKLAEIGYDTSLTPGELLSSDSAVHYNGMIHPLRKFTFKGVIWYQGESNSRRSSSHRGLFPALIESWRDVFGRGNIPFYFVQLTPYGQEIREGQNNWAWLRESQTEALALPNTGMVVTTDAGEFDDIHPQDKQTIGERLALHALKAEGESVTADSPLYESMEIDGDKIIITFANASNGLTTQEVRMNKLAGQPIGAGPEVYIVPSTTVAGFTISGADRNFVEATAVISGNTVTVSSPSVLNPVAVRYGWENFPLCNLYSTEGLPASPFRTENYRFQAIGSPLSDPLASLGTAGTVNTASTQSTATPIIIDGISGHEFHANPGEDNYLAYFKTEESSLKNGNTPYQMVQILYYDRGRTNLRIRYDSTAGSGTIMDRTLDFTNTNQWKVLTLLVDNAYFGNRYAGHDFRFEALNPVKDPYIIGGVYFSEMQGGVNYYNWAEANNLLHVPQTADQDADGKTNYQEFLDNTDPYVFSPSLATFAHSDGTALFHEDNVEQNWRTPALWSGGIAPANNGLAVISDGSVYADTKVHHITSSLQFDNGLLTLNENSILKTRSFEMGTDITGVADLVLIGNADFGLKHEMPESQFKIGSTSTITYFPKDVIPTDSSVTESHSPTIDVGTVEFTLDEGAVLFLDGSSYTGNFDIGEEFVLARYGSFSGSTFGVSFGNFSTLPDNRDLELVQDGTSLTYKVVEQIVPVDGEQPNIIIVYLDDVSAGRYFGYEGVPAQTPVIDDMVANGLNFENAFTSSTVCSPSRYTMLTGRYASRNSSPHFLSRFPEGQIARFHNTQIELELDGENIGAWMQKLGYRTAFLGKSHILDHDFGNTSKWPELGMRNYEETDDPKTMPEVNGSMRHNYRVVTQRKRAYGFDYVDGFFMANTKEFHNDYLDKHHQEFITEHALEFIDQNHGQNFFIHIAPTIDHGPTRNDLRFSLNSDIDYTPEGYRPHETYTMRTRDDIKSEVSGLGYSNASARMTWIDDSMKVLLEKLDEYGIRDNTLIVFSADHGGVMRDPGRVPTESYNGKTTCYDSGAKIPLFCYWPGGITAPGRTVSELTSNEDFVPTCLELAGGMSGLGTPTRPLDGESLVPYLKNIMTPLKDEVYCEIGYSRSVRTKTHKYVAVRYTPNVYQQIANGYQWRPFRAGDPLLDRPYHVENSHLGHYAQIGYPHYWDEDQIYDLVADSDELSNVYNDNPVIAHDLKKKLAVYMGTIPNRPFRKFNDGSTEFAPAATALPAAPSGFAYSVAAANELHFNWTDHSDNELGFVITMSVSGGAEEIVYDTQTNETTGGLNVSSLSGQLVFKLYSYNQLGDAVAPEVITINTSVF